VSQKKSLRMTPLAPSSKSNKRERRYDAHAQLITSRLPINAAINPFCVTFKRREVPRPPRIK
jgi:hypothetical protein